MVSYSNFQSDRCSGDRLQVSRAGNSNLADSERYCSGPFTTRSFSERIVVALLSPPQSRGGSYRCELYATKGCDCGRKKQVINYIKSYIYLFCINLVMIILGANCWRCRNRNKWSD